MTQIIIIQAANRNSTIAPSRRLLFKTWIGYSQLVSSFNFTLQINFCEMITIFTVSDWSIESRRLEQHVRNIEQKTGSLLVSHSRSLCVCLPVYLPIFPQYVIVFLVIWLSLPCICVICIDMYICVYRCASCVFVSMCLCVCLCE